MAATIIAQELFVSTVAIQIPMTATAAYVQMDSVVKDVKQFSI